MNARPNPTRLRKALAAVALGTAALTAVAQPALAKSSPRAAAQKSLPTYVVKQAGLTSTEAARLQKALGLEAIGRADDGTVRFNDPTRFINLPQRDGVMPDKREEDGQDVKPQALDLDAIREIKVLDDATALSRSKKALSTAKLLDPAAKPSVSHARFAAADVEGRKLFEHDIDTTVSYASSLSGLPLVGPGAKTRMTFDATGAVSELQLTTRKLAKSKAVAVADANEGARRCQIVFGEGTKVTKATLVYYAPALSTKLARLDPSYQCEGRTGERAEALVQFVPAAANIVVVPPKPSDEQPREGKFRPASFDAASLADPVYTTASLSQVDVGIEGTTACAGLPLTDADLTGISNRFAGAGVPSAFVWRGTSAWEQDWRETTKGGDDSNWIDNVDLGYWHGHGWAGGFQFCDSTHRDGDLVYPEASWGERDVEWIALHSCSVLADDDGAGHDTFNRWGPAFNGLHLLMGYANTAYNSADHGRIFAEYMLRTPISIFGFRWNDPLTVRQAWIQSAIDDQPSSVRWKVMGVNGTNGTSNWDDFFWGHGPTGPDIPKFARTGMWWVSGQS